TERLESEREPVVIVGSHAQSDRICSVETDVITGLRIAVKHLYELGHRNIAFLNSPEGRMTSDENFTGFLRATHEHGISQRYMACVPEPPTGDMLPVAHQFARDRLATDWTDVTGVICAASAISIGTAMAAKS